MKRNPMRILLAMLLCWVSLCGLAQEVTYIHERDIMNQFTTMETGAGVLSPAWYYNSLHKKYQRDANIRNKLAYRTDVMARTSKEVNVAAKVDSDYVERGKVEALNIASRSSASDLSWVLEKKSSTPRCSSSIRTSTISYPVVVAPAITGIGATSTTVLKQPSRSLMNPTRIWV